MLSLHWMSQPDFVLSRLFPLLPVLDDCCTITVQKRYSGFVTCLGESLLNDLKTYLLIYLNVLVHTIVT